MINAHDYLQSFRVAEQRIQLKIQQVQKLREQLINISAPLNQEQIAHTKNVGIMGDTVAAIIDIENEIDQQTSQLYRRKKEAYHMLDQIRPESAMLLIERFLNGKTVETMSRELHVCKRHAQRKLNDAILEFQSILNTLEYSLVITDTAKSGSII
ncbi:MAG: hypothetical protein IKH57_06560 [Clostridia bacterium]|nr:hypothetical protein [Clostridia bacterium]